MRSVAAVIAALSFAGPSLAFAQDPPPPPSVFGERVDVEVVNVDVVVTDRDGNRVTDLRREEFELRIDGEPVSIDYFSAPRGKPVGRAPDLEAATVPALELPSRTFLPAESQSLLVVFVDQSALEAKTSDRIVEQIRKFVLPKVDGSTAVLMAAFVDHLRIVAPLTTDRGAVARALDELEEMRGRGSILSSERRRIENEIRGIINAPRDPVRAQNYYSSERARLEGDIRNYGEQALDTQRRAVAALRTWVNALAAVEGRKSVLLATAGYSSNSVTNLQRLLDSMIRSASAAPPVRALFNTTDTLFATGVELSQGFEEMIRAAQNARVAFYTVSARTPPPVESGADFAKLGNELAPAATRDEAPIEMSSSVVRLGTATGGGNLYLDDDLWKRLERVAEDEASLYSLGFTTSESAGGQDHRIEVRVKRDGLTLVHRESFRRRSLGDRVEQALSAAVSLRAVTNPLGIGLELGAPVPEAKGKASAVPVLVRIPLQGLALVPEAGQLRGRLSARIAILDARKEQRMGKEVPIEVTIAGADEARVATHNWAYRAEMRLAPGPNQIAVVVVDEVAGVIATATSSIEVPGKRDSK